jgi:hypothetical protein
MMKLRFIQMKNEGLRYAIPFCIKSIEICKTLKNPYVNKDHLDILQSIGWEIEMVPEKEFSTKPKQFWRRK